MTISKIAALAAISKDIAQVFFASVFVAFLYGDAVNVPLSLFGLMLASVFWAIYVKLNEYE